MDSFELLKMLSSKLNLQYENQDWGIINADANRFEEFLCFYENNSNLHPIQKNDLCELIIASYNEAMIENKLTKKDLDRIKKFILEHKDIHRLVIRYWSRLPETDELPIVKVFDEIEIQ